MTISDAAPHNWPPRDSSAKGRATAPPLLGVIESISFTIGPEASAVEAMERARQMGPQFLLRLFDDAPNPAALYEEVQAVLTELVDVTARNKAGQDLVAHIAFDGTHATVSVGDMARMLPAPEEEPGLYLVHRLADDVGQYAGDHGGRVTWAAVPA